MVREADGVIQAGRGARASRSGLHYVLAYTSTGRCYNRRGRRNVVGADYAAGSFRYMAELLYDLVGDNAGGPSSALAVCRS